RLGWIILDWAEELLDDETRRRLRERVGETIARKRTIAHLRPDDDGVHTLGWLPSAIYTRTYSRMSTPTRPPTRTSQTELTRVRNRTARLNSATAAVGPPTIAVRPS
ncbi:MAG: hypothetical protein JWM53_6028, partial [bacterium]|nr:hypothetical protein [bacterium]